MIDFPLLYNYMLKKHCCDPREHYMYRKERTLIKEIQSERNLKPDFND